MKTRLILFGTLFLSITFISCSLIEDLVKIPIKITDEFTVPPLTGINTVATPVTGSSKTNIDQQMTISDSRKDKIKTIKLQECKLTIKKENTDFSFVKDLAIYLNAEGQKEVLLGMAENISPSATSINLSVHDTDLAAYLKQESVSFRAVVENKEIVLSSIDVEIFTKFQITADIFKR